MINFIYIWLYCAKAMRKPILVGAMIAIAATATVFASVQSGMSVPFVSDYPDKIEGSFEKVEDSTAQEPPTLTEEQKQQVLEIATNNPRIKAILNSGNWQPLMIGPWTEGDELRGGVALIRLDKAVWSQGQFGIPGKEPYSANLWIGNIHVYVDLQRNSVVGIEPGVGRPSGEAPTNEGIERARAIALSRATADLNRSDIEARLLAVYHTSEFPGGAAIFGITSNQGDEMGIGIDMSHDTVIERFTARAIK